jgi:DNA-binding protein H-NS
VFARLQDDLLDVDIDEIDHAWMQIEIETLSLRELQKLIVAAHAQQAALRRRIPVAQAQKRVTAVIARCGYTIEELFGSTLAVSTLPANRSAVSRRKTGKVPAKYRDPENRTNTWSGRGSMPVWLRERIKHGRNAADFLILGVAAPTPSPSARVGERTVFKAKTADSSDTVRAAG